MIIYKAILNGKNYIGQTKDLVKRKDYHKLDAKYSKKDTKFIRAIHKYGFDNIEWKIIYVSHNKLEINEMEKYFIKKFNSIKDGYNISLGGEGGDTMTNHPNKISIIKKVISKNHPNFNYIELTEELEKEILNEYCNNKGMIRRISKKYSISRNRIKKLLLRNDIEIEYRNDNQFIPTDELIEMVLRMFKNKLLIKEIAVELNLTILLISRILHESGMRESKRFLNGKRN